MARINIEDGIYTDFRFTQLCIKLGNIDLALGTLVRAWTVAQGWYLTPEKMIPRSSWKKQGLNDLLIEVGLAEVVGEKVRMAGADEQFSWLKQRSESGKKRASKSKGNSDNDRRAPMNETERESTGVQPLTLSPPLTLPHSSDSISKKEYSSERSQAKRSKPPVAIECLPEFKTLEALIFERAVPVKVQQAWIEAFPDMPWVIGEIRKAIAWEASHPTQRKKNFGAFMTRWMTRGWDSRRTSATVQSALDAFRTEGVGK